MASRYVPNNFSPLFALAPDEPSHRLHHALETLVAQRPPKRDYYTDAGADVPKGLWAGPTGFAHLFLHVARRHPQLTIAGRTARDWAEAYLTHSASPLSSSAPLNGDGTVPESASLDLTARVGINCELLVTDAVAACLSRDPDRVRAFLVHVPAIVAGSADATAPTPDELLQGRAGTLYLLRLIREQGLPHSSDADVSPQVEAAISAVTGAILGGDDDDDDDDDKTGRWRWKGKRYLGAAHGDAGILAQLVLTTPALAATRPAVEAAVARLLDEQLADGNWPVAEESRDGAYRLVQFCHGVVGVVPALVALRPHFPALRGRIDAAVERGRACVWREGLLVKEPSICHGIFGSALSLARGPQRDHFLALTTPERASSLTDEKGQRLQFEAADYGREYPTISGSLWSAAWTWMVCGDEEPGLPFFTDA